MSRVIVIGAGASGLMAAIVAARNGNKVTLLEQCDKVGKKIYATGNGRCNFTNLIIDNESFRGNEASFAYNAIKSFNNLDLINFFIELGLLSKDINGYVYPYSEQAKAVPNVLLSECNRLNVSIITNSKVVSISTISSKFSIKTNDKLYECDKLIISVGGMASPNLGSDGSLYTSIKALGHKIIDTVPALCSIKYADKSLSELKGVRYKCGLTLMVDENQYINEGEIIFNNDNINGIPVMQLSRYASYGFRRGQSVKLYLDLLPSYNTNQLIEYLSSYKSEESLLNKNLYDMLSGFLNDKLANYILKTSELKEKTFVHSLSNNQIHKLTKLIKHFEVKINDVSGYENAQVMAGGVSTDEINNNMQSKIIKNLYFAGEVIDIDGNCGGYNLQWAFTSGYIAGLLK